MDRELKDYLDRQQGYLEREFADIKEFREEANREFAGIKEFREETRRGFAELRDEIHQTRILVEKLDDKIDLVAEGVQNNTEVMHRLVDEGKRALLESKVIMESAHRHLEKRVSQHDAEIAQLGRRVGQLES